MKIAQLLFKATRQMAGVTEAARGLSLALMESPAGLSSVHVLALADEFDTQDAPLWAPLCPRTFPVRVFRSPAMIRALTELQPDLVHCHGLWRYHVRACSIWHSQSRHPYVVTPHGMLANLELRKSRWKKKLALLTYQGRHLKNAACLHALCEPERRSFRALGLRNPICLIPNGVSLSRPASGTDSEAVPPWRDRFESGRKVLLYLARINRKKGVHFLLDGWKQAATCKTSGLEGWALAVAGWDQDGHEAEFRAQTRALGLDGQVAFIGPQFGQAKVAALRGAAAFVLPSQDEGLPIGVLEAWSYGLPVLMTRQCNLPEGFAASAAIAAEPEAASLSTAMGTLFGMTDAQRREMGAKGRKLVEERFTWPQVARQMKDVYDWLLGGGNRPPFISTC